MKKLISLAAIATLLLFISAPAFASGNGFSPGRWGWEQGDLSIFYAYAYEIPAAVNKLEKTGFDIEHIVPAVSRTEQVFPLGNGCHATPEGVICVDDFSFHVTYSTDMVMLVARKRPTPQVITPGN